MCIPNTEPRIQEENKIAEEKRKTEQRAVSKTVNLGCDPTFMLRS